MVQSSERAASSEVIARDGQRPRNAATIFLCGDVMVGRGIDQILPHPGDAQLHEGYVASALGYVHLAENAHGAIPRPVGFDYVWGAALDEWQRVDPDLRLVNLETAITRSDAFEPKGINYRMDPQNIGCLLAAGIDCCCLANNHVLDWGEAGLLETLEVLERHGISAVGAGRNPAAARAPAVFQLPGTGRVIVFSYAMTSSGTPKHWSAMPGRAGVNLLSDLSDASVEQIGHDIAQFARIGDAVIVSIHWGPNWGYAIPDAQQRFSRGLIDRSGASIVHGHSSHHPKALEHYRNGLILYGCGDFLNDYEGIAGYEEFRSDLSLMYFVTVEAETGRVSALRMLPLQIRRFRLNPATCQDAEWLRDTLDRECRRFGGGIAAGVGNRLVLV